jgi:hypothetical protein
MDRGNDEALARLEDALSRAASEDAPIFALVGAGSSARLGYPLWEGLLRALEDEVRRVRPEVAPAIEAASQLPDPLWRAEECRRLLGEARFARFIERTFAPNGQPSDGFHRALVALPFRHVLTTNYDLVLESAHEQATREKARSLAWDGRADLVSMLEHEKRAYVHLYGRYDGGVVLCEWDFRRRYVRAEESRGALAELLGTHPIVSVGFSLSDLDLMAVFREVAPREDRAHGGHFAFLPLNADEDPGIFRRWLVGKFAIEPIFYRWTEDHSELDELVARLVSRRRAA